MGRTPGLTPICVSRGKNGRFDPGSHFDGPTPHEQLPHALDHDLAALHVQVEVEDGQFSMTDLMQKTAGSNAQYLMKVLDAWNLDEDLTLANAQQLADELPAAAAAIMEMYRLAVTEGRLGN